MLLWLKKNHSRLLAGFLMGCALMFLSGCFTLSTIDRSKPITIGRSYGVEAVESAEKLPNGDVVLFVKGRDSIVDGKTAAGEPRITTQPSSFALLLSAKEIQAAKEKDEKRQQQSPPRGGYPNIPAIRCEMPAAGGGAPLLVMRNIRAADERQIMGTEHVAAITVADRFVGDKVGFRGQEVSIWLIRYVEQRNDRSVFHGVIEPDAKDIQISRRKNLWWLPLAVVGDVVTLPLQVVGAGLFAVGGLTGIIKM